MVIRKSLGDREAGDLYPCGLSDRASMVEILA
jgi:hypothetical protein